MQRANNYKEMLGVSPGTLPHRPLLLIQPDFANQDPDRRDRPGAIVDSADDLRSKRSQRSTNRLTHSPTFAGCRGSKTAIQSEPCEQSGSEASWAYEDEKV